ncbi:MAG: D-alanyl-D-alanine carboxypeptidase [Eubacteriales bacterium]|nr:D-alanyl-D-alanine carboxypeptidase [Eubacteriales bacterium]
MKRLVGILILLLLLNFLPINADAQTDVYTAGACLIEASTGRVLYEKNADKRLPMASTTKVMTALLTLENCSLDEMVKIDDRAVGVEGSSMYLGYGETLCMRDLMYGLMLTSGNDAAVAIAIHVAGDVESFVELMNTKAVQIGCQNTNFVTPNGLHNDNHYSSARDMALIGAYAMQMPEFREIVSTNYHQTTTGNTDRTLKNKNRLLWEYEGGNGVKTGYTTKSGKCLVFAAKRDGMQVVGAVLSCPDMWNAAKSIMDYGFENYEMAALVDAETTSFFVPVKNSEKKHLAVSPEHSILYPIKINGDDNVNITHQTVEYTQAPVMAGSIMGSISAQVNGEYVGTYDLIAVESAQEYDLMYYLSQIFFGWLSA